MSTIRIMIADDHSLLREGIRGILASERDLLVVGECTSGSDAAEHAARLRPDVVLLDLDLPGPGGAETARKIRECCPGAAVLALTLRYEPRVLMDVIRAGAGGYVLKDVDGRTLVQAIRGVHRAPRPRRGDDRARMLTEMEDVLRAERDHLVFGGRDRMPPAAGSAPGQGNGCPLTAREREVLAAMATGASNGSIARALFISEKTVKNHATSIFRKIEVRNRRAAVVKAVHLGWIEAPQGFSL